LSDPRAGSAEFAAGPSRPAWRGLAYTLAGLHIAYVMFVMFGALLVPLWRPAMWLHIAAVAWAGGTMLFDFGCPITDWEKSSLRRGGRDPYPEGFLQHHLLRTRFDPATTRRNHVILGLAAIALNVTLYFLFVRT
jgi:hypothetical protein